MEKLKAFLGHTFKLGKDIEISTQSILIVVAIFIITSVVLRIVRRLITRKLAPDEQTKFVSFFSFIKYFIFIAVFLFSLDNVGVDVTAVFAASAALLIGIGLALQTLFQDIICGVFVLLDKTVHVGDVVEIDGKVFKVTEINLRTTRGINIENKVLVIPNHIYLTSTLYNWTQNNNITRENVMVGVAYGSDVDLVTKLLLQAANNVKGILKTPEPTVFFLEFADSALSFKLVFTINDSFWSVKPKSDLHYEINKLFKAHKITIPFPQRDVHLFKHN